MARNRRFRGISDLEREFELDMESEPPDEEAFETDLDEEFEADLDEEYAEEEGPEDLDQELELMAEGLDEDHDPREMEFAERFYELGQREFESEFEVERELAEVLDDMEREYFLGRLIKGGFEKFKGEIERLKKSKLVRGLVNKGLQFAQQRFPALKAVTQLARGNLKGMLLPLAKTALGAAVPGGPAALSVLQGLGFEAAEDDPRNRIGWQNYTRMAREAYETLADNVTMRVDEPRVASQLAASAFQQALGQAQARAQAEPGLVRTRAGAARGRVIRVRLRPGQKLVVTRGRK
jgi:hypothetical protein